MAEDLNIVDIASKGVVKDTPPIALAPNIFTDVRNVRFKDGAIRKMEGELLLNNIADELTGSLSHGKVRYFAAWQDPNLQPTGCYYIFVVDLLNNNIIVGQKVYIQDHLGTKRDITPSTLNSGNGFTFTTDGWMHTLFNGGFTFIINNGIEKPHYIKDTPGNTNINNIVLAELPGWDSYNVAQTTHSDTFSTGDSNVFDLGQKVDFAANSISVTGTTTKNAQGGSPAGSGTVNGTNFVPGALPGSTPSVTGDNFQIYTDAATNTTVVIIGNLSNGNTVTVNVNSRNPVNVRCGVLEAFGNLLVAGDLTEIDTSGATIRRLSGVVRTSDVAAPGALPINWNPFEAGASTADEFTLSETSQIQDMKPLQGNMYIYATDSIHAMRLTGNVNVPVSFAPVTDEYGALTKGAVKEYDGKHFVVGRNDIYVFQGNPSNIQSLAGGRVQTYFFNNLNPIHENQLMLMQNHLENEIWVCYPTLDSLAGELDEVLIWNYRDNTWTIRDLNGVMSGDMGPVKGGGIPSATIALTGNSGSFGYTNRGKKEVVAVTINGKTPRRTVGTKAKKTISVGTFSTFQTNTREVVDLAITGDTGPNVVNQITTLTFPSSATFAYDRTQSNYLDGGASAVIKGSASHGIGDVSFPAVVILGNDHSNGATINMTTFVAAIRDYINSNAALSDFTATASTNVLTLTSDVPGPRTFNTSTFSISGGSTSNLTTNTTTAGVGVYGISSGLSPAISMRLQSSEASGIHAAIDQTITLAKDKTAAADIRDDIITKLQALSQFNGNSSSIYSVAASGNNVRLTSRIGANHNPITITFSTSSGGSSYSETTFGGNLNSSVTVVTAGVDNSQKVITLTVTFPDASTQSKILDGQFTRANIVTEVAGLINAGSGFTTATATGLVTATSSTVGVLTNNFSVALTCAGSLPTGFTNSTFTAAQTRAGVAAASTTDSVTLTPPLGNPITVNFNDLSAYPAYEPDGSQTTAEVTDVQIATALQAAHTDTTHFTVTRSNEVLTFTATSRKVITGNFAYTVVNGTSRTGTLLTGLITNSTGSNIATTEGVDIAYARGTRVTLTANTASGSSVLFDKHYGEGPGRLLDPSFTKAANDSDYGQTSHSSNSAYLAAYYNTDATQDSTELAKPNGGVQAMQQALLDILAALTNNALISLTPDSSSSPTNIVITPSQFSSTANFITAFAPVTEVVTSRVAPTTTNLTNAAEGTNVSDSGPTFSTSGTSISTTFDIIRPWEATKINATKIYPILLQSETAANGTITNRIRVADLGFTFAGANYVSYFERIELSISPTFDTEQVNSMALWADGGSIEAVGGEPVRATLRIRARSTNNPGQLSYLTVAEDNTQSNAKANKLVVNDFNVASNYKSDMRVFGRLINYRIDDAQAANATTAANNKAWNVSGLQLDVNKGGKR
tara:strand:- start:6207 stop:10457 length:4251 start_codon:yes stop_codon:yes gene_type:complete